MSSVSLRKTEDQQAVEAVLNTQIEGDPINEAAIKAQLAESEYHHYKRVDSGVAQLVAAALRTVADKEAPSMATFIIASRLDAELKLNVSSDKLAAKASITAAFGGNPVDADQLQQSLTASGVRQGLDQDAISQLLQQAQAAEPGAVVSGIIAQGKKAVNGLDGRWVSVVETLGQQLRKPKVLEDGSVDMLDFGEIATVKKGALLMRREPPTRGENGYTVTGESLAAVPGKVVDFIPAEGVAQGEDPSCMVATRDGMPVEENGGMRVDNVYTVKQVNMDTGHIVFDGSVIILGDVEEAMKVSATGDVSVGGSVFFARVEAEGDITVRKGVVGHQRQDENHHFNSEDLSCSLLAKGEIHIGFAQYARLEGGKDIQVDKQLLHCLTDTPAAVAIGKNGDRNSKLIGGITRSGQGVQCGIYGTEAFIPTEIELCPDLEECQCEVMLLNEQLSVKQMLIEDLKKLMPKLSALPKSPQRKEKITKLINTVNHSVRQANLIGQNLKQFKEKEEELLRSAQLIAHGTLYPNVSINISGHPLKLKREYQGGGVCYRNGEVIHDPALKSTSN